MTTTSFHVFGGFYLDNDKYIISKPSIGEAKQYINETYKNRDIKFFYFEIMVEREDGQLHTICRKYTNENEWKSGEMISNE